MATGPVLTVSCTPDKTGEGLVTEPYGLVATTRYLLPLWAKVTEVS